MTLAPDAASAASCSVRTFEGPQPKRPSAGLMSAGITMSATSTRLLTCADCLGPGPDSETRTMNGRGPQKDEDHRGRAPQRARTTKERGPAGEAGGPARGCSEVLRCAPGACQMVPMTSEAPGTSDSGREAGPTYLALGRTSRP